MSFCCVVKSEFVRSREIFVELCGVILSVLIILATSDASLYAVFVLSILMTANLRFKVCIILSTTPIAL